MTKIIEKTEIYGLMVYVAEISTGFSISCQDMDFGGFLPDIRVFKTLADAKKRAKDEIEKIRKYN